MTNLYTPSSHDQIVEVVKKAYDEGRKVRVLATGHSWSNIVQTSDIMISLCEYQGVINLDREKMEVTVKAGTTFDVINSWLDAEGLAFINLGSISTQTVAGAISTGKWVNKRLGRLYRFAGTKSIPVMFTSLYT